MAALIAAPTDASDLNQAVKDNDTNVRTLATFFYSSTAPTSPSNGWIWCDSTDTSNLVYYVRQNGAWVAFLQLKWPGNADCNGKQAVNLLIEKLATGSLVTTEARIQWDQTIGRLVVGDGSKKQLLAQCANDGTTLREIPCELLVAGQGANKATVDDNTKWGGWLLDAATDVVNVRALQPIPSGWTGAHDLTLRVRVVLAQAETLADTLDLTGNWYPQPASGAAVSLYAFTGVAPAISGSAAQYSHHDVDLTIDWDGPTTDLAVGDIVLAELSHDVTSDIADIIVVGATLLVPVYNYAA